MSLDQVSHVAVSSVGRVAFDELHFLGKEVSTVLHDKLRVGVKDLDHVRSLDIVIPPQEVEKTSHVGDFAGKEPTRVFALKNELIISCCLTTCRICSLVKRYFLN